MPDRPTIARGVGGIGGAALAAGAPARMGASLHGSAPFAGGERHYAAFLEDAERFKVELVASDLTSVP